MSKLSNEALQAINLIREEYGDEIANELLYTKITKPKINCDVVNEYHITLLKECDWMYINGEFGAIGVDFKRPYGNSDVIGDIRELTGLPNSDTTLENLHRGLVGVIKLWTKRGFPALDTLMGQKIEYDKIKR